MKIKLLPEVNIPLINVSLPSIELPEFPPKIPKLDERQIDVLRYAIMDDLADIVPFIGDVLSDIAYAELKKKLTIDEYEQFLKDNKWLPSTIAVLKTFTERKTY
ncbi:MAG: hypothetical protein QW803_12160 [Candidatus Methanomethylicia archaeon]